MKSVKINISPPNRPHKCFSHFFIKLTKLSLKSEALKRNFNHLSNKKIKKNSIPFIRFPTWAGLRSVLSSDGEPEGRAHKPVLIAPATEAKAETSTQAVDSQPQLSFALLSWPVYLSTCDQGCDCTEGFDQGTRPRSDCTGTRCERVDAPSGCFAKQTFPRMFRTRTVSPQCAHACGGLDWTVERRFCCTCRTSMASLQCGYGNGSLGSPGMQRFCHTGHSYMVSLQCATVDGPWGSRTL